MAKGPTEPTVTEGRPYLGDVEGGGSGPLVNQPSNKQYVRIVSKDLDNPIELLLGATPPTLADGGGGFEVVARPRQLGMTTYTSQVPFTMSVEVTLDNMRKLNDMNPEQLLDRILRIYTNDEGEEPAPCKVYGATLPLNGWKWVLNNIDWADDTIRDADGRLKRQTLTLTFLEFVKAGKIKFKKKKKKGGDGGGGKPKKHTVKQGETLYDIAKKYYGDRDKWKKIAERNDLRGPRSIEPGDVLIIP